MAFSRNGYGQVEPNQLSAQKTGQIYASLPLASDVNVLQNGEFMYYDYKSGTVTADGVGEPMLVFNEIKLYEPFWQTSYKDFAMIRKGDNYVTSRLATAMYGEDSDVAQAANIEHSDYVAGYRMDGIAPRLLKTNIGDIMTTNMVAPKTSNTDIVAGKYLVPTKNATTKTLVLTEVDALPSSGMAWVVVKDHGTDKWSMPDGQPAVKIQRVQ